MLLDWSEQFSVKIPKYDAQHRQLFSMIDNLQSAMEKREGSKVIHGILAELIQYTNSHFSDEEEAMKRCGYPLFEEHRKEHLKLKETVKKYQDDLNAGRLVFTGSILNFLINWLKEHIAKSDKKYTPFLSDCGRSANTIKQGFSPAVK